MALKVVCLYTLYLLFWTCYGSTIVTYLPWYSKSFERLYFSISGAIIGVLVLYILVNMYDKRVSMHMRLREKDE